MINKIKNLLVAEEGQGMTEYGLVLGIIALGVVAILGLMRNSITNLFQKASDALQNAASSQ